MRSAVVLAAGRGTRMQEPVRADIEITPVQEEYAAAGLKGLIPFAGHPFLSYTLSALGIAGYEKVCLIVRPGDDPIRSYYEELSTAGLTISFAVQEEPLGTADALLAAEAQVREWLRGGEHFLVLNGDNYYPAPLLERLRRGGGAGLAGFSVEGLSKGNISRERIRAFALLLTDQRGRLTEIIEKPDEATYRALIDRALISMTCWRFGSEIFEAARAISPSPRGEYEIPDAVRYAIEELGTEFEVIPTTEPVLDLSTRADIPMVAKYLHHARIEL